MIITNFKWPIQTQNFPLLINYPDSLECFSKNNNSKILDYLTFLNLGVLKNIILRLKNNIEIVRAGKI